MEENARAKIDISFQGKVAVVSAAGELDFSSCKALQETFQSLEEDSREVVFDLREASYLDSEALKVIVNYSRDVMEKEGKVAMVCGKASQRVISLVGVSQLLSVRPDIEAAVQHVTASS